MAIKRIQFINAPSGTIDKHQRYMIGVGLDPFALAVQWNETTEPSNPTWNVAIEPSNASWVGLTEPSNATWTGLTEPSNVTWNKITEPSNPTWTTT